MNAITTQERNIETLKPIKKPGPLSNNKLRARKYNFMYKITTHKLL